MKQIKIKYILKKQINLTKTPIGYLYFNNTNRKFEV